MRGESGDGGREWMGCLVAEEGGEVLGLWGDMVGMGVMVDTVGMGGVERGRGIDDQDFIIEGSVWIGTQRKLPSPYLCD